MHTMAKPPVFLMILLADRFSSSIEFHDNIYAASQLELAGIASFV
jgi:hypothetical protein